MSRYSIQRVQITWGSAWAIGFASAVWTVALAFVFWVVAFVVLGAISIATGV